MFLLDLLLRYPIITFLGWFVGCFCWPFNIPHAVSEYAITIFSVRVVTTLLLRRSVGTLATVQYPTEEIQEIHFFW